MRIAFTKRGYRPDSMAIVAVGDLDPVEMEAKIKRQFSDLKAKRETVKRPDFPVADTEGTLVRMETGKEAPGTNVQLPLQKTGF